MNTQLEEDRTAVATILCIEDYSEILEVLQKTLRAAGYNVLAASSGAQGLDLFALNGASINAIVLDLQLPDMTGKEVAILIKKQHAHLPIILFSGCTQDIYLALPECFDAFVEKPRLGDIPQVLKRLLNARPTCGSEQAINRGVLRTLLELHRNDMSVRLLGDEMCATTVEFASHPGPCMLPLSDFLALWNDVVETALRAGLLSEMDLAGNRPPSLGRLDQ